MFEKSREIKSTTRLISPALNSKRLRVSVRCAATKYFDALPKGSFKHTDQSPSGCCGGRHLERGVQEAEKTHEAPYDTHPSSALEHETAEDSPMLP